ncbi:MAG: serine hydrolase domain-containing protein [Candidatus Neomarinimicrobiota bacterium]
MSVKKQFRLLPIITVITIFSCTTEPEPSLSDQLQEALDEIGAEYSVPGISAAVNMPDGSLWLGTYGNSHEATPITTDMAFCIGSVTKSLVATLVMQLAEEDLLTLEDSLHEYLPVYKNIDTTITIRQLLTHRSGIFNFYDHPAFYDSIRIDSDRIWSPDEILSSMILEPYWAPGSSYSYSNTNYILLGMIIETVTGESVSNQLNERIFESAGMDRTYLYPEDPVQPPIAHDWYDLDEDGLLDDVAGISHNSLYSAGWTAGSVYSTPNDLINFSRALFGGGLVEPASLTDMLDMIPVPYGENLAYGLGISVSDGLADIARETPVGHDGAIVGYSARWVNMLEAGIYIAITINHDDVWDAKVDLSAAFLNILYEHGF